MRARRALGASTIGSIVEAYDWTIYGALAPYFSDQLFPGSSPAARLLAAYLGFALGFLVRPVGSIVIGRLADTRGRRFGLVLSITLAATASLAIAVVPGYSSVGISAPLWIVAARLVQGLSVGAENPSAAAYVTETAPAARRYLYSAVSYGGVVIGSALSLAVVSALLAIAGESGLRAGGWRIGFLAGALLGLVGLWIRTGVTESRVFTDEVAARPRPRPTRILRDHVRAMAVILAVTAAATTVFYFCTVHLPVYASDVAGIPKVTTSSALLVGMVALLVAMLAAGMLADRFSAMWVLRIGFGALALLSVPLLRGMAAGAVPVLVVVVVLLVALALPLAVSNVFAGLLFAPAVRVVAAGLPAALAISVFGGGFPAFAELLRTHGRTSWIPWWIAGIALVALLASWGVPRSAQSSESPLPERDEYVSAV
ncbi:MFS transporter [Dactylosporangium sp. NPDC051484]|uniref:MFS transporter n=1 Tax=Dactylosporangium sp. NPDC051484 TaxID=3154942 RepID=UPI00344EEDE5